MFAISAARAEFTPASGYEAIPLVTTEGTFTVIEGLDVVGPHAYIAYGTNIASVPLVGGIAVSAGSLPPNANVNFLKQRAGVLHAGYGQSFASPFPCRFGVIDSFGQFVDQGGLDGLYDAAVNGAGELFMVANPSNSGTRIFRFDPATTAAVEVIQVGGYSGGIAFDSAGRLYVAEQTFGDEKILRFTPQQLTNGNLTATNGEAVVQVGASYLCFDTQDRLYAVSGYGNHLSAYDVETGALIREVASDPAFGYGIGRIGWDAERGRLIAVYTDYGVYGSTLYSMPFGFAPAASGIAGTSTVFQGWIRGWRDFNRPVSNSGGMARADDLSIVTNNPATVVIGRPDSFDGGDENNAAGHVLSLGQGGSIVLEFDDAIADGPGPDFAVFENAFIDDTERPGDSGEYTFAEFAFVEVATTTNAWARFPVTYFGTSVIYNLNHVPNNRYASQDVTLIDGVAGKNTTAFGTPFDLATLATHPAVTNGSVDLDRIAFVRIVDIPGDGTVVDDAGRPIFDPYYNSLTGYPNVPAPSLLDGFDLRAVGVIHTAGGAIEPAPVAPVYAFHGYAGRSYQVESSVDGVIWSNVNGVVTGTGGVHRVALDAAGPASIMLRLTEPEAP